MTTLRSTIQQQGGSLFDLKRDSQLTQEIHKAVEAPVRQAVVKALGRALAKSKRSPYTIVQEPEGPTAYGSQTQNEVYVEVEASQGGQGLGYLVRSSSRRKIANGRFWSADNLEWGHKAAGGATSPVWITPRNARAFAFTIDGRRIVRARIRSVPMPGRFWTRGAITPQQLEQLRTPIQQALIGALGRTSKQSQPTVIDLTISVA